MTGTNDLSGVRKLKEVVMKYVLLIVSLCLAVPSVAVAGPLGDLEDWGRSQEIRTGGAVDGTLQLWAASYWVPVSYGTRGWRTNKKKSMPYFDAMVGLAYAKGKESKALIGVQMHPFNLAKWAFSRFPERGKLAKDRFKTAKYPNLSIGPAGAFNQRDAVNMFRGYWKRLKGAEMLMLICAYSFNGKTLASVD